MEETSTQTAPHSGASNAADFQPTTQNPQGNASEVQQQGGIEQVTNPQEFLNENKTTELSVRARPAPPPSLSGSNNVTTLVFVASVAIVVAILLFKISNRLPDNKVPAGIKRKDTDVAEKKSEPKVKKTVDKRKVRKTKRRNR